MVCARAATFRNRSRFVMDGVMANEEISVKQSREDSELDDIHVPGLGVRGALADDEPEKQAIWSWARDTYSRQAELAGHWVRDTCFRQAESVGQWKSRALKDIRLAGSRQVVNLTKVANECKGALTRCQRLAVGLANSADHRLRKVRARLATDAHTAAVKLRSAAAVKDRQAQSFTWIVQERQRVIDLANFADHGLSKTQRRLAAGAHNAALKLRSAVAANDRRARAFVRTLQERRGEFLRVTPARRAQIDKACKEGWARISKETVLRSRRAQLFLAGTVADVKGRVRMPVGPKVNFRLSRDFQFDLPTLRRGLPALAALLVIATFVLEAALWAGKR